MEELVVSQTETNWTCPKDGTVMKPLGRRSGAWRCPTCRSMFIDREGARRGGPPMVARMLMNVAMGLAVTAIVRRLRRRKAERAAP